MRGMCGCRRQMFMDRLMDTPSTVYDRADHMALGAVADPVQLEDGGSEPEHPGGFVCMGGRSCAAPTGHCRTTGGWGLVSVMRCFRGQR